MGLVIAAYGGGINSTAMLIEVVKRQEPVDLVMFADTGGERPDTYRYIDLFSRWLEDNRYPRIVRVQRVDASGTPFTLEEYCLRKKQLPSLAYGFKSCSQKHKGQPQDKFVNNWDRAREAWKNGGKVTKLIGYDADEPHRIKDYGDDKYILRYPLVEWNMGREECEDSIRSAGLPMPGKSSCFFCPSMKHWEIRSLRKNYPDLLERALLLEATAKENFESVKGLGRSWSWADLVDADERQLDLFQCPIDTPCGCYDGITP